MYNICFINVTGAKEQLVSVDDVIDGVKPKLPNSVVVASDGTVYWTDSDTNYALHDGLYTLFADGTGRFVTVFTTNIFYYTYGYYMLCDWKIVLKKQICELKIKYIYKS